MLVRAIELGFYGGSRRRPGEVFMLNEGQDVPKWAIPASEPYQPEAEQEDVPVALSQLAKAQQAENAKPRATPLSEPKPKAAGTKKAAAAKK